MQTPICRLEMDGSRAADFKKKDGLGRIRTGDLRHVKTPFMAPSAVPNPPTPQYNRLDHEPFLVPQVLSDLALQFTLDDLTTYVERRKYGLSKYSIDWINRSQKAVWDCTNGIISKETIDELRLFVLSKYKSEWSHIKVFSFAKAFLKFLTKVRLDTRYHAFEVFLERPRKVKIRNNVTSRIVTKEDIQNVLAYISNAKKDGLINDYRAKQYTAFVVFGAFTGQRSLSTIAKLTVGQFRRALQSPPIIVEVQSTQDKIKMQHYVPLHPQVIQAIEPLLGDRSDDNNPIFDYNSLAMWVKRHKISLTRATTHFVLGDLRKFTEQYGDIIQWNQSNRAYIMTHGVSGIDWKHYKHPLPEHVYDVYMNYWKGVRLTCDDP
jgi:integrase